MRLIYCWFGGNPLPKEVQNCMASWKKAMPDIEIMEINENNFDINYNDFVKGAYENKKWAFVSDVARLWALYEYGGIYLDTDVMVYRDLRELFNGCVAFTGFEQPGYPVCAVMGTFPKNEIIKQMLDYYNDKEFVVHKNWWEYTTNTTIMSEILDKNGINRNKYATQQIPNMKVYSKEVMDEYQKHLMLGSWG